MKTQEGECEHCRSYYKSLKAHKCPVQKMIGVSPSDLLNTTQNNYRTCCQQCDGCRRHYFLTSSLRQFRRYKNVEMCVDCYSIPQIQKATSSMLLELRMLDIKMNKTLCSICAMCLIDRQSGCEMVAFKRDYIDYFCTRETVWDLVHNGSTLEVIRAANEMSRNMCLQCFSAISHAKHVVGIRRLRPLQLSDPTKHTASKKVDAVLQLLIKTNVKHF
jgi:hypothetical protein